MIHESEEYLDEMFAEIDRGEKPSSSLNFLDKAKAKASQLSLVTNQDSARIARVAQKSASIDD